MKPIPRPTVAIFGYGSLVAPFELKYYTRPDRPLPDYATLWDFERNWEVGGFDYLYLGIAPKAGNAYINGCIFYADRFDLMNLDRREQAYHRTRVDGKVFHHGNHPAPVDGPIYTYLPNTFAVLDAQREIANGEGFVSKRYDKVVKDAFKEVGPDFYKEFVSTTVRDARIKVI